MKKTALGYKSSQHSKHAEPLQISLLNINLLCHEPANFKDF